jgi:hypothetical protein
MCEIPITKENKGIIMFEIYHCCRVMHNLSSVSGNLPVHSILGFLMGDCMFPAMGWSDMTWN